MKKSRYYSVWSLFFMIILYLLGGCMKKSSDRQETPKEQTLKLNFVAGDVPSLDPHQLALSSHGSTLCKWLFEGLTRLNLEGKYELAGAKSVELSPCQTRYTFTLRSNHYSDGDLVTAYDYENCWKQAIAPRSKCPKAHLFYYIKNAEKAKKGEVSLEQVGVKAINDHTLIVDLSNPTPHFLALVSTPLFSPFKAKNNVIVPNGPYMITERKKDNYLSLAPNPFFWDHDQIAIHKIKVLMIQDAMTSLALYKKKEIDWVGDPFSWLPPDIISSERAQGTLFRGSDIVYPFWVHLNTKHPILSSPLIRRALHLVIDRKEIATHLFPDDEPLFTPIPSAVKASSPCLDLVKGQELFMQGLKELHLTKETMPPLKLSSCNVMALKYLAEYLKEKWEDAFGIQVDLDIKEWNTFYADVSQKNYQIAGLFIPCEYNDPIACLDLLANNNNFSAWNSSQYQTVIDQLKMEGNPDTRACLLRTAEEILEKEAPIIWLINKIQYHAYRSDLKGICFDQRGNPDLRWAYFE